MIYMTCHLLDLAISATEWLKIIFICFIQSEAIPRSGCGVSVLGPQTSFSGETSEGVTKYWLFSQAKMGYIASTYHLTLASY